MELAQALREARARQGWSQERTARRLEVSLATYSRWERGICRPHLDQVAALADHLEVSLREALALAGAP